MRNSLLRALTALALLLAPPPRRALAGPPSCDAFCAGVKKLLAARQDGFKGLRGKTLGPGAKPLWRARYALPGASQCDISGVEGDPAADYVCVWPAASPEKMAAAFEKALADVSLALPPGWTSKDVPGGPDESRVVFAPPGFNDVVLAVTLSPAARRAALLLGFYLNGRDTGSPPRPAGLVIHLRGAGRL